MKQRTEGWFKSRCGKKTASRFKDVLAKTKSGPAATRETYKWQIVGERITGEVAESYQNSAMRWGTGQEPHALAAFEWATDIEVEEVGFITLDATTGCSPDGLIGEDDGLEIKCPFNSAIHLQTIDAGEMPAGHKAQVQGCMFVTGRTQWNFVSFDPRMPPNLQLFYCTVKRDETYIAKLAEELAAFDKEVEDLIEKLTARPR